jgi:hypothetical protein
MGGGAVGTAKVAGARGLDVKMKGKRGNDSVDGIVSPLSAIFRKRSILKAGIENRMPGTVEIEISLF